MEFDGVAAFFRRVPKLRKENLGSATGAGATGTIGAEARGEAGGSAGVDVFRGKGNLNAGFAMRGGCALTRDARKHNPRRPAR